MVKTQWKAIDQILNESARLMDTNKQLDDEIRSYMNQSVLSKNKRPPRKYRMASMYKTKNR